MNWRQLVAGWLGMNVYPAEEDVREESPRVKRSRRPAQYEVVNAARAYELATAPRTTIFFADSQVTAITPYEGGEVFEVETDDGRVFDVPVYVQEFHIYRARQILWLP